MRGIRFFILEATAIYCCGIQLQRRIHWNDSSSWVKGSVSSTTTACSFAFSAALPLLRKAEKEVPKRMLGLLKLLYADTLTGVCGCGVGTEVDRKSTRLNSSHQI